MAPYHHHDVSAEEDLRNIFAQIEDENSVAKVERKKIHAALLKAGIQLDENDIDTVKEELPDNFQTAEKQLEKGFLDKIVDRRNLRDFLEKILTIME